jgi:hypothetical protein
MTHTKRRGDEPRAIGVRLLSALSLMAAISTAFIPAMPSIAYADQPVAVGEVSTIAGQEDVAPTIKTTLAEELSRVKAPPGKKFVVSASLVKFETKNSGSNATTQAVISLAIRDAKDGAIRGVVSGSGLVTTKSGDRDAAKLVVETAVRGATKSLPVVLAKSQ